MSFTNKVVLITGASSGIGAAIALKLAEDGANVAIVGRNVEKLKSVSESIAKVSNEPLVIVADVGKEDEARRIVNDTLKQFGKLDVLINNAGVCGVANVTDENTMAVFDHVLNTNLRAAVYLTHLACKHLIKTKGNIVNISSVAGILLIKRCFSYCVSKAALDHFTRSIAIEFAPTGVRVNSINPGPVRTDIIDNMGYDKEFVEAQYLSYAENSPLPRVTDSSEIAELAFFLASDKAAGITGSNFVSDNGILVRNLLF